MYLINGSTKVLQNIIVQCFNKQLYLSCQVLPIGGKFTIFCNNILTLVYQLYVVIVAIVGTHSLSSAGQVIHLHLAAIADLV